MQRSIGWNQTLGHCRKDKVFVLGAPALPNEQLGARTFLLVTPYRKLVSTWDTLLHFKRVSISTKDTFPLKLLRWFH